MRHRFPSSPKPAPFPYKEKNYNFFRALFDPTTSRLDDNSKIIVVEGLPTAGKGALAKRLADELDMLYIPSPTVASTYINDYGYDLKTLDGKLPPSCQSYDENDFLKDPLRMSGSKAGRFQLTKYQLRYQRYLEALAHVLNTGQGVVMDRSPHSDFVYAEAMFQQGFINKNMQNIYNEVRTDSLFALWKPHLVIYLDLPAEQVRRRIEERNVSYEKNSPATSLNYLKILENTYKKQYLKDISIHAEVLIYDWTEVGDTEILVEDIERLDFDQYTVYDKKMEDWRRVDKWDWNISRHRFTHRQDELMVYTSIRSTWCPEILIPSVDMHCYDKILSETPGSKYAKGFNADMGDKGILFKLS